MGIFLDPPNANTQENLRSEIGIQIYGEARFTDGILIKELPAMEVASISHKGTSAEYPKTYKDLSEWITRHGYEWAGPSIEIYTRKPKLVRGETILFTKIMAPLRKTMMGQKRNES
jgi:effector-binding domain-containing protein